MRLVDDDAVPVSLRQLGLHVLVARRVIETRDHNVTLGEGVSAARRLDGLTAHDVELETAGKDPDALRAQAKPPARRLSNTAGTLLGEPAVPVKWIAPLR